MRGRVFLAFVMGGLFVSQAASGQNTCTVNTFDTNIDVLPAKDTLSIQDPVTGEWNTTIRKAKLPLVQYRDGRKIFKGKEASQPIGKAAQRDIQSYFRELFADELYQTKDIFDFIVIVIDERGKPAMFETNFLTFPSEKVAPVRKQMLDKLKDIVIIPAKKDGKDVPYLITIER
jgi:hypothetical protein